MKTKLFASPFALAAAASLSLSSLSGCETDSAAQSEVRRDSQQQAGEAALADDVKLPELGVAVLQPSEGQDVAGVITFETVDNGLHVSGTVTGLEPGDHGFHIHEFGDLRDPQGESAGGHFNPTNQPHGGLEDKQRHVGDLGNIVANESGKATVDVTLADVPLHFILGRGLVVHGGADDLESQPSGNAGPRVAVGVIGIGNPSAGAAARQ